MNAQNSEDQPSQGSLDDGHDEVPFTVAQRTAVNLLESSLKCSGRNGIETLMRPASSSPSRSRKKSR